MRRLSLLLCFALAAGAAFAQQSQTDWNAPFPPHRVMDNLYFVGTAQLGSFLIVTPAGNILDQQRLREHRAVPREERRIARLQVHRHQDSARQSRARRSHGGRRARQEAHGRHRDGDGARRAGAAQHASRRQGASDRPRAARRRHCLARRDDAHRVTSRRVTRRAARAGASTCARTARRITR